MEYTQVDIIGLSTSPSLTELLIRYASRFHCSSGSSVTGMAS